DDRVIQLQINRYTYNWRKKDACYPRYETIYPEFMSKLQGFRDFLRMAGLEDISLNQWEITYVNHIPRGELWSSQNDWYRVFPGLYHSPDQSGLVQFESITGEWHYEIVPQRGRLHIVGRHSKNIETSQEFLELQLTARGPIEQEDPNQDVA